MRASRVRGAVVTGLLAMAIAGCGGTGSGGGAPLVGPAPGTDAASPVGPAVDTATSAEAKRADAAPAEATPADAAPAGGVPASSPTGPSIRVSDGESVVALDPATGGRRSAWPAAAISLRGDWTVALTDDAKVGGPAATWVDAFGVTDHAGPVPAGLRPALTSADGRWAVFEEPAPPRAKGEIGPRRTTTRFVVTNGAGWAKEVTLDGNFAPEAFGGIDPNPLGLQMIEYLPPDHPTRYRVRTLDLVTGAVGLPVNLQDKATPVDESMAGTSRTQVYAPSSDLLFTLYQPSPPDGATSETWEYGFVHTLAASWGGVWCIDLPDILGLEDHGGTLALRHDERALYVATSAGRIGEIRTEDLAHLVVGRTADLGVTADEPPVMVAGADRIWVALGRHLMVVDPTSLDVLARAELPAPVTALTLDAAGRELVAADVDHLRTWSVDDSGQVSEHASAAIPLPSGLGPVSRIVLPM